MTANRPPLVPVLLCVFLLPIVVMATSRQSQSPEPPAIDDDDIGGVVMGPQGPEAGVWVIAETRDLDVRYIKIVVTDDAGRYVVPDLPTANYAVWARGYGLVDSAKTTSRPGRHVNITATPAPTPAAAAEYYPAIYWYSMLRIPTVEEIERRDGIADGMTQQRWVGSMKNLGCIGCHQIGQRSTRTIPPSLGTFATSEQAWIRRVQSGQSGQQMLDQLTGLGTASFRRLAEWTDRIAAGELPHAQPVRPQGVERRIVVTLRDWISDRHYLHDLISSDRRYPTVNAYGPLYGSPEYSSDLMPILDPVQNTARTFRMPVRDAGMPVSLGPGHAAALKPLQPSSYWGDEVIWETRANNHNSMFDRDGRLWLAAAVRGPENPSFCREGSTHPSAQLFPTTRANRHLAVFDPRTEQYTFVDTCFSTHHLQFGYDADDTLWTSGGGQVLGWLNTQVFLETGDAARSQGWTAFVLDTNGNGRRDDYVEPNDPVDPTKDKRIGNGFYAVMPSPVDGSIWGTNLGNPGAVIRVDPGPNPPHTALAEIYRPPLPGFGVRGGDIDSNGVVWVRSAAVTSAASIGASARGRSTVQRQPAITVLRDGRSTGIPARGSRGLGTTVRSPAITRGSISTTRSGLVRTCRCRQGISTMA